MTDEMKKPRRYLTRDEAGVSFYGVYFPGTDLSVNQMCGRGTGAPAGVEWLDSIDDLTWIKKPTMKEI